MDDTSCVGEETLEGSPSSTAPDSDRPTMACGPDGPGPDQPGATVASQGVNPPVPDAGAPTAAAATLGPTEPAPVGAVGEAPSTAAGMAGLGGGQADSDTSMSSAPAFGTLPDPDAVTSARRHPDRIWPIAPSLPSRATRSWVSWAAAAWAWSTRHARSSSTGPVLSR